MNTKSMAIFAGVLGNSIFGLSFVFTNIAFNSVNKILKNIDVLEGADFATSLSVRFLLASLFMTILIPILKIKLDFKDKPIWKLLLLGLFQPILYFIGESYGIKFTGIIVTSIVISLVPAFSQIASSVMYKDKPSFLQIIFTIVAIAAVVAVTILSGGKNANDYAKGVIFLIFAIVGGTGFYVMGKSASKSFSSFERTYAMFILGAIFFTVYSAVTIKGNYACILPIFANWDFVSAMIYLGCISSVLGFFLIGYATENLSVTQSSSFTNIIPVVSTTAGFIIEKKFNIIIALCCVVIVIAVTCIQKFTRKSL